MKSIADGLPPEIAAQVHPDWRKNEAEYWTVREQLLEKYQNQWVGFAQGRVIASGSSAVEVLHAAHDSDPHAFLICVGREDEPTRIRRSSFPYDTSYRPEPLPSISVEFKLAASSPGVILDRVIPDTGADSTVLPWSDCQRLQLLPTMGVPSVISGVAGGVANAITFRIWARLDGTDYQCRLLADFTGNERILGRDVLNRLEILFRGPSREVVVNP